ncbi:MAG: LamB/YcsF family protein [Bacteroidota bacterium]|nr:LamB/YcsF family protein [Bacteroidota bacterium]
MIRCDLNCDLGEGMGNDAAIIPYITSANIACGYHAGDETTMRETVILAKDAGVAIGAHPSFLDKENFGRTEIEDVKPGQVYELVMAQLDILQEIVFGCNARLYHVKPHGALYNMAAKNASLANAIAKAVHDFDKSLVLFGLSGSHLISEANAVGLKTASEVFADRTYQNDGNLTPRGLPNALIEDEQQSLQQVLQMIRNREVTATSGKKISIVAETVCLHGDGKKAVEIAKAIHQRLKAEGIKVMSL